MTGPSSERTADAERERAERHKALLEECEPLGMVSKPHICAFSDALSVSHRDVLSLVASNQQLQEALTAVGNAYGCFAGCTGALPGAPDDGSGHTPACHAARAALAGSAEWMAVTVPSGTNTHADTIRERIAVVTSDFWTRDMTDEEWHHYMVREYNALADRWEAERAEVERERERAERAQAALRGIADAPIGWPSVTMKKLARAALSVGSGERETTFDGSNTAPCVPRERGAVITAAREECAKLIDTKVAPLLASGSLPPMWTWWLPLVDAISERLKDAAGSGGREPSG